MNLFLNFYIFIYCQCSKTKPDRPIRPVQLRTDNINGLVRHVKPLNRSRTGRWTEVEPGRFTQTRKLLRFCLPLSLSFFHSERNHTNPAKKPYHCKPTPPPQGVAYCRRPSHKKGRHPSVYLASLVLQVFNPCSLSPIAAASSSSASVVFVCSAALPSPIVCRSRSLGVHRSRLLAVHRSSSHLRSSGSHVALLQTLRPSRALHLAVELLSFVAAIDIFGGKRRRCSREKQGWGDHLELMAQITHTVWLLIQDISWLQRASNAFLAYLSFRVYFY